MSNNTKTLVAGSPLATKAIAEAAQFGKSNGSLHAAVFKLCELARLTNPNKFVAAKAYLVAHWNAMHSGPTLINVDAIKEEIARVEANIEEYQRKADEAVDWGNMEQTQRWDNSVIFATKRLGDLQDRLEAAREYNAKAVQSNLAKEPAEKPTRLIEFFGLTEKDLAEARRAMPSIRKPAVTKEDLCKQYNCSPSFLSLMRDLRRQETRRPATRRKVYRRPVAVDEGAIKEQLIAGSPKPQALEPMADGTYLRQLLGAFKGIGWVRPEER